MVLFVPAPAARYFVYREMRNVAPALPRVRHIVGRLGAHFPLLFNGLQGVRPRLMIVGAPGRAMMGPVRPRLEGLSKPLGSRWEGH